MNATDYVQSGSATLLTWRFGMLGICMPLSYLLCTWTWSYTCRESGGSRFWLWMLFHVQKPLHFKKTATAKRGRERLSLLIANEKSAQLSRSFCCSELWSSSYSVKWYSPILPPWDCLGYLIFFMRRPGLPYWTFYDLRLNVCVYVCEHDSIEEHCIWWKSYLRYGPFTSARHAFNSVIRWWSKHVRTRPNCFRILWHPSSLLA